MTYKKLFPPLLKGDKIGIASVSGKTEGKKISKSVKLIESLGYLPVLAENIFFSEKYMSGNDEARIKGLLTLLSQKDIKAIVFARGGYGAIRILDKLDFSVVKDFKGFFMGYSDITVLLNLLIEKSDNFVFHGPNFSDIDTSDQYLIKNIFNGLIPVDLSVKNKFIRQGKGSGILCGGNLASLASLCGTRFIPDFKDKVFFIEDINEAPYKIDRMITQLRLSGCFESLRGVIAGSFEECGDMDVIFEILKENFKKIPIVFSDCFGHGKINNPLLLGSPVEINSFSERVFYL